MDGATYPAQAKSSIEDSWLVANANDKNAVHYCMYRDGKDPDHFSDASGKADQPRGIMIRGTAGSDGTAGFVRGYLWDENHTEADDHYLVAGVPISLRFRRIYARGTTARGIKILY